MDDIDLLAGLAWSCARTAPGAVDAPASLHQIVEWLPATVPGTAASALRDAGLWRWGQDDEVILDGSDWWWRIEVPAGGKALLELGGLATLADVWLGDLHLLHSESMFVAHRLEVEARSTRQTLAVRCAALGPQLAVRRPRPRWRSLLQRSQQLRWFRTSTLGRNGGWTRWAAPVGPWRRVTLTPLDAPTARVEAILPSVSGDVGRVDIELTVIGAGADGDPGTVRVGEHVATLRREGDRATASVEVREVVRWWPHTHGTPTTYPVEATVAGRVFDLGSIGFKTTTVRDDDGGFTLMVNDVPIFCRGAVWVAPDVVALNSPRDMLRRSLERVRDAGMNMLRVGGQSVYDDEGFWDLCDELGILVWQDCMIAAFDPPEDGAWLASLAAEMTQVVARAAAHPALAVVCGSSEVHQQAAMLGLPDGGWGSTALDETIPALVEQFAPGTPYVASSPTGGDMPFYPDRGPSHYFGVGAYLRPVSEARLSGVRFASECLALSGPPERRTVDEVFGGSKVAAHAPEWKAAVPRDASASWDFEDVTDHYVTERFGVAPLQVRYADPDHALDLKRAAVADVISEVLAEWRRPSSVCAGGLVLAWQDLAPGAGWGLLDALGRPKSAWFALRRVLAPTAVTITDDGLIGLTVQIHHDRPTPLVATLDLDVYGFTGARVEQAHQAVEIGPHEAVELRAVRLLGCFRDLNDSYRFGPSPYDVVVATLRSGDDVVAKAVHCCGSKARPRQAELGLQATARRDGAAARGWWVIDVETTQFAQQVVVELEGGEVSDAWFHLEPGGMTTIRAWMPADRRPVGTVRALNGLFEVPVTVEASG